MPTQQDLAFAKAALRRGLAAKEVLQKCLEAAAKLEAAGAGKPLKQILVESGVLDAKQVAQIEAALQQNAPAPAPPPKTSARQKEAIEHGHVLEGAEFCDRCADYVHESDISGGQAVRMPDGRVLCFRCVGVDTQEDDVAAGYRLGPRLRATSLGNLHKATHLSSSRECCVEIIPEKNLRDKVPVKRLVEAALYAARFEHPRILQTLEAIHWQGAIYLGRDFVPHSPLDQILSKAPSGKLSLDKALQIANDLAEALTFTFDKDLFHGSIEPSKIIVTEGAHALLTDLGLPDLSYDIRAKRSEANPCAAPELQRTGEIDIRSDIYSLGQVFCEMLTGGHWIQPDPPTEPFGDGVPASVRQIVEKATSPEPKQRYTTPLAMVRDLHVATQRYETSVKRKGELAKELDELAAQLRECNDRLKPFGEKVEQENARWSARLADLERQADELRGTIESAPDRKDRRAAKRRLKEVVAEIKLAEKEHAATVRALTDEVSAEEKHRKKILAEQTKRQREMEKLSAG